MAKGEKRQGEKQHSEKAVRKVTAAESEAVRKHHLARLEGKPSVRFTVAAEDNHWVVRLDHPDERIGECLLADALGSTNRDFVRGIAAQLIYASEPGATVTSLSSISSWQLSKKANPGTNSRQCSSLRSGRSTRRP